MPFSKKKIRLAGIGRVLPALITREDAFDWFFNLLDFKCTDTNNDPKDNEFFCPSTELHLLGLMLNLLCKAVCVCGLIGVLWPDHAASQTMPLPRPVAAPPNPSTPPEGSTRYVPLGQVLPRATQESGIQFQVNDPLLTEEVPVSESGPNRNINLEPVLDEFSRIEIFGDDSKLRKVIILNRKTGAQSQAPTAISLSTRIPKKPASRSGPVTRPVPKPLPTTNLSKEQLQALIRGAYRSPLPDNFWDDPDYREFLVGQGITSREEMKDRNKAKNVRKTVRRLLWQLKNKS